MADNATTPTEPEDADWVAGIPNAAAWGAELAQPWDDTPDFDPDRDPEVDAAVRLSGDKTLMRTATRRMFVDYRQNPDAYAHLETLPGPGQSLHGVISGKYALWELVPALIARTGQVIDELTIATLSFSKHNAAELLGLLDDGRVKKVGLLVSYFFKAQNRQIYDSLVPQLRERGHQVLAMRTHCKLMLAQMADGTCFVCESSANLRSSVNVEQFVLTQCPELFRFHREWIYAELLHGTDLGDHGQAK